MIVLLARHLLIDHFAYWQLGRASFAYVLILMGGGYYAYVNILVQDSKFELRSVHRHITKFRIYLMLTGLPFFLAYLVFANIPYLYISLFLIPLLPAIWDYDVFLVAINKAALAAKLTFAKALMFLAIAICITMQFGGLYLLLFGFIAGISLSAYCIIRTVRRDDTSPRQKAYKEGFVTSLRKSAPFSVSMISQTLLQNSDLVIAGVFLTPYDISHYAIALVVAELALMPTYSCMRVIVPIFVANHDVFLLVKYASGLTTLLLVGFVSQHFLGAYIYAILSDKYDVTLLVYLVDILWIYVLLKNWNTLIQVYLNYCGMERFAAMRYAIGAAACVWCNIIFIPKFGISAMPIITAGAEGLTITLAAILLLFKWKKGRNPLP